MFLTTVEMSSSLTMQSIDEWANIVNLMKSHVEDNFLNRCENGAYIVDYELVSTPETLLPQPEIRGNTCPIHVDFIFIAKGVIIPAGTIIRGAKVDQVVNSMVLSSGRVQHGKYSLNMQALGERKHYPNAVHGTVIDMRVTSCRYMPKNDHIKVVGVPIRPADGLTGREAIQAVAHLYFYVDPKELTDFAWVGLSDALACLAATPDASSVQPRLDAYTAAVRQYLPTFKSTHVVRGRADFAALTAGYYYLVPSTADRLTLGFPGTATAPKKTIVSAQSEMTALCLAHAQLIYSMCS